MREHGKEPIKRLGEISEQVLSGIVQSIEAAVVLHDRKLKVVFVNDAFEDLNLNSEDSTITRENSKNVIKDFMLNGEGQDLGLEDEWDEDNFNKAFEEVNPDGTDESCLVEISTPNWLQE